MNNTLVKSLPHFIRVIEFECSSFQCNKETMALESFYNTVNYLCHNCFSISNCFFLCTSEVLHGVFCYIPVNIIAFYDVHLYSYWSGFYMYFGLFALSHRPLERVGFNLMSVILKLSLHIGNVDQGLCCHMVSLGNNGSMTKTCTFITSPMW